MARDENALLLPEGLPGVVAASSYFAILSSGLSNCFYNLPQSFRNTLAAISVPDPFILTAFFLREIFSGGGAVVVIKSSTTPEGENSYIGLFYCILLALWNLADVVHETLLAPANYKKAKESAGSATLKTMMADARVVTFCLFLFGTTAWGLTTQIVSADIKNDFWNATRTLGKLLALQLMDFAFAQGLLLSTLVQSYSLVRACHKLSDKSFFCSIIPLLRGKVDFNAAVLALSKDREKKLSMAKNNPAISADKMERLDEAVIAFNNHQPQFQDYQIFLVHKKLKDVQKGFVNVSGNLLGFIGAFFGFLSMLACGDLLVKLSAGFYTASALIKVPALLVPFLMKCCCQMDNNSHDVQTKFKLSDREKKLSPTILPVSQQRDFLAASINSDPINFNV